MTDNTDEKWVTELLARAAAAPGPGVTITAQELTAAGHRQTAQRRTIVGAATAGVVAVSLGIAAAAAPGTSNRAERPAAAETTKGATPGTSAPAITHRFQITPLQTDCGGRPAPWTPSGAEGPCGLVWRPDQTRVDALVDDVLQHLGGVADHMVSLVTPSAGTTTGPQSGQRIINEFEYASQLTANAEPAGPGQPYGAVSIEWVAPDAAIRVPQEPMSYPCGWDLDGSDGLMVTPDGRTCTSRILTDGSKLEIGTGKAGAGHVLLVSRTFKDGEAVVLRFSNVWGQQEVDPHATSRETAKPVTIVWGDPVPGLDLDIDGLVAAITDPAVAPFRG